MNVFSFKHKKHSEKSESIILNSKGYSAKLLDNRKIQIIYVYFN